MVYIWKVLMSTFTPVIIIGGSGSFKLQARLGPVVLLKGQPNPTLKLSDELNVHYSSTYKHEKNSKEAK